MLSAMVEKWNSDVIFVGREAKRSQLEARTVEVRVYKWGFTGSARVKYRSFSS